MSTTATVIATPSEPDVLDTIERACARIAPAWPLDRFIAVNPLWGRIDQPLPEVAAQLRAQSGARMLMPRAWYRQRWEEGGLRQEHLAAAIEAEGASVTVAQLEAHLEGDEPVVRRRARVVDVVDTQRNLPRERSWREYLIEVLSQFCASTFDDGQGRLGTDLEGGLYASWLRHARVDLDPSLRMGMPTYRELVRRLPDTAAELATMALSELDVPASEQERYLHDLLLDLNGWASWCAYRRFTAQQDGSDDDTIVDLVAIRLAWEWMLLRAGGDALLPQWRLAMSAWPAIDAAARDAQQEDWLLQRAVELAYQGPLCKQLPAGLSAPTPGRTSVQAAFCIDVRSEVLRRALEAHTPKIQTLGFAGFFGMPIAYQTVGSSVERPQLPGPLAPRLRAVDGGATEKLADRRRSRVRSKTAWHDYKTGTVSTFAFVESMGATFVGSLLRNAFSRGANRHEHPDHGGLSPAEHHEISPRLAGMTVEERVELAEGMLRAMSLTRDFARIVALVGHGSSVRNNPHRAGYDCGACCGQSGDANARVAAELLSDPEVRAGLAPRGIEIPEDTCFVAGLHDTTTDEVTLFDLDRVPATHAAEIEELEGWFEAAGDTTRKQRAASLRLHHLEGEALLDALRARAGDWSQVRPEWGLAGNAAFIVAPREHCRHLDLDGRSFLHDYRHEQDEGYATLELIMTAPMVVTHWINFQYYASTVDNLRYGSGNKVLHDIVGGHIGIFEGNGGDLRIGLPMQSIHDGERFVHEPLRLAVFIEAPAEAIENVIAKHEAVRNLVNNGWITLHRIDEHDRAVQRYEQGTWHQVGSDAALGS